VRAARERGAIVVAVDLPSGLGSDDGKPLGSCVRADVTVTFGYLKRPGARAGSEPRRPGGGRDISLPRLAEARLAGPPVFLLSEEHVRAEIPHRDPDSHKGRFGHVLAIAGSAGKTGAAAMTCQAALRGGAGLVTLVGRVPDVAAAQAFAPEIMSTPLSGTGPLGLADLPALLDACQGKTVLAIGPGLGCGPETGVLLGRLLGGSGLPAVLDADALTALAGDLTLLDQAKGRAIVTPHPGEMSRLVNMTTLQVQDDRLGVARRFADAHQVVVVLKGARTVVADLGGATAINPPATRGWRPRDAATSSPASARRWWPRGWRWGALPGWRSTCTAWRAIASRAGGARWARRHDLLEGVAEVWASWGV